MNFQGAMEIVGADFAHIPLGLATIAALTPPDLEVAIIDENVEPVLLDERCDVVAFTGIYCQRDRLFELARQFRRRGKRIVIGGPIAEDLRRECEAECDVLFLGEAEYTWPQFCADLVAGTVKKLYHQLEPVDMADSPIPRFELLRAERYSSGCVQATRGCPYRCEYCDVPRKLGNRPRCKPIERVLEEVRRLHALGFESIFFVDDMFIGNRRYARDLLRALAALLPTLPRPIYFYTQLTLNVAKDEELLDLFADAGFRRFFIGIESSNLATLRNIDKSQNCELPIDLAIERIQARNITVWAGIILGLDDDGPETFDEQLRFIERTAITPTLIGLMQAMPGAPLYDRIAAEQRLVTLDGIVGSGALGTRAAQTLSNVVPRRMSLGDLQRGAARLMETVFDPQRFASRLVRAMKKGKRPWPSVWRATSRRSLQVLGRAVQYYLFDAPPELRRMFLSVIAAQLRSGLAGFEEAAFHLVIYKHLYAFYGQAARDLAEAAARAEAKAA